MNTGSPLSHTALDGALEQWGRVVGTGNIITHPSSISFAETATFQTNQRVLGIIQPADREQVQECVRIANQYRIPVYPVSTGKNWGYGSRVPAQDGCVLMKLHRLNQILEHNEELGYVTLEPGVTLQQLHDFLRTHKSELLVPMTGSSPHTSILGNAVERGASAVGREKADCICALEVVLPNGKCIHTGFGRLPNARASNVNRWGVGPSLDGMFLQSSLGIVTRMTIWLTRRHPHFVFFAFLLKESSPLPQLLASIRSLFRSGGFPEDCGGIHLFNSYKMLAYRRSYPWQEMEEEVPLPKEMLSNFFPKSRMGVAWHGAGVLSMPSAELVTAYTRIIKTNLKRSADATHFFDNKLMGVLSFLGKTFGWLRRDDVQAILQIRQGPLFGIPSPGGNLRQAYWRKKSVPNSVNDFDPDRDRCGVIWLFIVFPFEPDIVDWGIKLIEKTSISYRFEPVIEIHAMSHRSVLVGLAVLFDRDVEGEDKRARHCHDEIFETFSRNGYYPYRLGIQHVGMLPPSIDYYDQFLAELKHALDPNHILAPGRYEFGPGEVIRT